jgi:hypothetical protein
MRGDGDVPAPNKLILDVQTFDPVKTPMYFGLLDGLWTANIDALVIISPIQWLSPPEKRFNGMILQVLPPPIHTKHQKLCFILLYDI